MRPTQPPVQGYWVFPGGKERPERDADPSPPSSAVGHERVELYLYPPISRTACTEPQCLYKGVLYLYPYIKNDSLNICGSFYKNTMLRIFNNCGRPVFHIDLHDIL